MKRKNENDKSKQLMNLVFQLSVGLFALVYMVLGYYVIKLKWLMVPLDNNIAWALGMLLIVYGIFRAYRAYLHYKDTL